MLFAAALLWIFRVPVLIGLARAWIVDEAPVKADAIIVLGGGREHRPYAAAELYRGGWAPMILIPENEIARDVTLGIGLSDAEATRRILHSNGVPDSAISLVGTNVASTFDEAAATRQWMRQNHGRSILVPTDLFHTRRARWIFARTLEKRDASVTVLAVTPHRYTVTNWWQTDVGLVDFQNEVLKLIYYKAKH